MTLKENNPKEGYIRTYLEQYAQYKTVLLLWGQI